MAEIIVNVLTGYPTFSRHKYLSTAYVHFFFLAKKKDLFHGCTGVQFLLLPHPPYSPQLSPCDFFLFPGLNQFFCGKKIRINLDFPKMSVFNGF